MAKHYTENDLLLYLYGEMSRDEAKDLELALLTQDKLQQSLNQLKSGMEVMGTLEREPSQTSIEIILEYSRSVSKTLAEV